MRFLAVAPGATAAAALTVLLASCGGGDPTTDLLAVSSRDGDYAVYAMRDDGGGQTRLTDEHGDSSTPRGLFFQVEPAWTPDGAAILFASKRTGNFDLYTMRADGSDTQRLTSTREDDGNPSPSPDGRLIAFDRGTPGGIWIASADGSGARRLGSDTAPETQPAWSPDGGWIAYVRRRPGTSIQELWRVRPDGSGRQQVTRLGGVVQGPSWSPGSERIVFSAVLDGTVFDIYSVTATGKSLRRHTKSTSDAIEPSWSPDGRLIAFAREGSIVTIDLEGNVEEITDPAGNDSAPAWNPNAAEPED